MWGHHHYEGVSMKQLLVPTAAALCLGLSACTVTTKLEPSSQKDINHTCATLKVVVGLYTSQATAEQYKAYSETLEEEKNTAPWELRPVVIAVKDAIDETAKYIQGTSTKEKVTAASTRLAEVNDKYKEICKVG